MFKDDIKPASSGDAPVGPTTGAGMSAALDSDAAASAAAAGAWSAPDSAGSEQQERGGTTKGRSSSYTGVSWNDRIGRWEVSRHTHMELAH